MEPNKEEFSTPKTLVAFRVAFLVIVVLYSMYSVFEYLNK